LSRGSWWLGQHPGSDFWGVAPGTQLAATKMRWIIPGVSATWQRPIWSASFSIGVHERLQSLVS